MNSVLARITQTACLYGDTYITWFDAPEIIREAGPGQFVMLRCVEAPVTGESPPPGATLPCDPLLPRPFSIHRLRDGDSGREWALLYDVVGAGTRWLASRRTGDQVHCWGPLGRGFDLRAASQHVLLVAGGIGVAPLVWLADDAVECGKSVTMILGGRSAEQIFPASRLPPQVELVVTTEDGSLGRRGLATEAFSEHLEWCDQALACGPNAMFQAMAEALPDRQRAGRRKRGRRPSRLRPSKSVQVLLEERMGCGTGICYGCSVQTHRGMRLVCMDGPMFELQDVF